MSRRLFVDCGGHDGCSVVEFLAHRPGFRALTFEPNPALWRYYRYVPTRLLRKAVATHDGTVELILDPVDGDGSTIVPGKSVVRDGTLTNEQCPRISVPCVDLSRFLAEHVDPRDHLCLKLDVEGAEYAILERMLAHGTIDLVDELFVEFHWERCGIPESRHRELREALAQRTELADWHVPKRFLAHRGSTRSRLQRALVLGGLWPRHALLCAF